MTDCLMVSRSLTYAQRTARALERAGLRGHIAKIKPEPGEEGCIYAVRTAEKTLTQALELLSQRDLKPQRVFCILSDGSYKEMSL